MKKGLYVLLLVLVAAASSASTIGVMKYLETRAAGGDIIILSDERCADCNPERFQTALTRIFPDASMTIVDYGDRAGKKLYEKEALEKLPVILIPKSMETVPGFEKFSRFAKLGKDYYTLSMGATFDPNAEICDNEKDDNGNDLVDCADPSCKSDWLCMEKRAKPDVDVFVMSHCPYGTQFEKGLLPVWDLFGDKINLNIRFVDYAMHGKKEVDEQLKQYCIQKQDEKVYRAYLECFLADGDAGADACLKKANVDAAALKTCIADADKQFGISKDFADKAKWQGRFPPFGIYAEQAKKYGVRGSPTLVINDVVAKTGRSPKSIQDAICRAFKEKPAECGKALTDETPSPGFGMGKAAGGKGAPAAKCGS